MGYTTDFNGSINIEPPLNVKELNYLSAFNKTRHMDRKSSPYYIESNKSELLDFFSINKDSDIIDFNRNHPTQPGLYCKWKPSLDGDKIIWDQGEKFYDSAEWMQYLIDNFLSVDAKAKIFEPENFKFLNGHTLNGLISAQGEEPSDKWYLAVNNNKVKTFSSLEQAKAYLNSEKDILNSKEVDTTEIDNVENFKSKVKKLK